MANVCQTIRAPDRVLQCLSHDSCEKCEHVESGATAVAVHTETDSFGPVMWLAVCQPCLDKDMNELFDFPCIDCKEKKKVSEMRQWRWYDFYAAQGDEPLNVCDPCWNKPKHVSRKQRDHDFEYEELGY